MATGQSPLTTAVDKFVVTYNGRLESPDHKSVSEAIGHVLETLHKVFDYAHNENVFTTIVQHAHIKNYLENHTHIIGNTANEPEFICKNVSDQPPDTKTHTWEELPNWINEAYSIEGTHNNGSQAIFASCLANMQPGTNVTPPECTNLEESVRFVIVHNIIRIGMWLVTLLDNNGECHLVRGHNHVTHHPKYYYKRSKTEEGDTATMGAIAIYVAIRQQAERIPDNGYINTNIDTTVEIFKASCKYIDKLYDALTVYIDKKAEIAKAPRPPANQTGGMQARFLNYCIVSVNYTPD